MVDGYVLPFTRTTSNLTLGLFVFSLTIVIRRLWFDIEPAYMGDLAGCTISFPDHFLFTDYAESNQSCTGIVIHITRRP